MIEKFNKMKKLKKNENEKIEKFFEYVYNFYTILFFFKIFYY